MKKKKTMVRVLALLLAIMLGVSALGGIISVFASELPNIDLAATNNTSVISGVDNKIYFRDNNGNYISSAFYDEYDLELEVLYGYDYFDELYLEKDDDDKYFLSIRAVDIADLPDVSQNKARIKITCRDIDTGKIAFSEHMNIEPLFVTMIGDETLYVPAEDFFGDSVGQVHFNVGDDNATVELGDYMTAEFATSLTSSYNFSFTQRINSRITALETQYDAVFEVYDFMYDPQFATPATITIESDMPYVYRYDVATQSLTAVSSVYEDDTHTFTTHELDFILLSNTAV